MAAHKHWSYCNRETYAMKFIFDEMTKSDGDMSVKVIVPPFFKSPCQTLELESDSLGSENMFSYL